mmetsp:Transcript_35471/g.72583  ORF Transcript_35471/g.72583 Transcript_35471/m.72583 type:complete len:238 (-) Transcript_35471:1152-1865(-)
MPSIVPSFFTVTVLVSFFFSSYPLMPMTSSALDSTGANSHPLFFTTRPSIVPEAPSSHLMTRAPSRSKLLITTSFPFTIREDRDEILISEGDGNLALYSPGQETKSGLSTRAGPRTTLMPLYSVALGSSTLHPIDCMIFLIAQYWSASPLAATPGCVPFFCSAAPSIVAFLTGEKHISAAALVNPALSASSPSNTVGKSCIMHSSLVGFLKAVLVSSLYLGLTNSGMAPLVRSRTLA